MECVECCRECVWLFRTGQRDSVVLVVRNGDREERASGSQRGRVMSCRRRHAEHDWQWRAVQSIGAGATILAEVPGAADLRGCGAYGAYGAYGVCK